jgi:glycosyltransferase involved in cell wall biosynthesis
MRLVLDLQGAQGENRHRGIGRYSASFAEALIRNAGPHEVVVAFNEAAECEMRDRFAALLPPRQIAGWTPPAGVGLAAGRPQQRRNAELLRECFLASLSPDIVHVSSLFEGLASDTPTSIGSVADAPATSVTLYDLIPLMHPDLYLERDPRMAEWYREKLEHLRRAELLLAISDSSRREAIAELGLPEGRVVAVGTAADPRFRPVDPPDDDALALRRRFGLKKPFLLYTGGIDPRKNVEGLIAAFAALPPELRDAHQLAVVCATAPVERTRLSDLAARAGLPPDGLVLTGFVEDADLAALYALCRLFVFPSLHEGFGLPLLEAMASGAPAIAADNSSMPEIVGRKDALFPAGDAAAFAAKLHQALSDADFRRSLRRDGLARAALFTWDAVARRAWDGFAELHRGRPRRTAPAPARPTLAFVSPLPPAASGIADYAGDLLPSLAAHYDIELVADQAEIADPWIEAHGTVRDFEWLRLHGASYDRILYHFGNSALHAPMFDLLARHPGVVVLHDVYLGHVLAHRELHDPSRMVWSEALYNAHGYHALHERWHAADLLQVASRYPCSLGVLQDARGGIVHSRFARDLVQDWFGPRHAAGLACIPLLRAPPPPIERAEARRRLGLGPEEFLVCSFGMLGPIKLNHRLLAAFRASEPGRAQGSKLVFVGDNDAGDYGRALAAALDGKAAITGYVEPELYRAYLAACDLAVQLRADTRGETPASLLDCLNYGVPAIANAHGAIGEIPEDALFLLADAFTDAELSDALDLLWRSPERRRELQDAGRALVRRHHAPEAVANLYRQAIESFYAAPKGLDRMVAAMAAEPPAAPELLQDLSIAIARSFPPAPSARRLFVEAAEGARELLLHPPPGWRVEPVRPDRRFARKATLALLNCPTELLSDDPVDRMAGDRAHAPDTPLERQLFVDVSELVARDAKSGIQRVVRQILAAWVAASPPGWRIEPVFADEAHGYRRALRFAAALRGEEAVAADAEIAANAGDCFVGLDLQPHVVPKQAPFFAELRRRGVAVLFVAYDLLCVERPEFFLPGADENFTRWLETVALADGVLCISQATADSLARWMAAHAADAMERLCIDCFPLGADFSHAPILAARMPCAAPRILMVGTIEPRKAYGEALDAAEALWRQGEDFTLTIVGRRGWMMEELIGRLSGHAERDRRLFWHAAAEDDLLDRLYREADGLLLASEGEGFGLPLVEAAWYGLPILARDLPVFREVAGEHARYFGADLAADLRGWLDELRRGAARPSHGIRHVGWAESARALARKIVAIADRVWG